MSSICGKSIENGIEGLLSADNIDFHPLSYYLNAEQQEQLNQYESYFDENLNLMFVKTDFRFDDPNKVPAKIIENEDDEFLVVFTHEWILSYPLRKNLFILGKQIYRSFLVKKSINDFYSNLNSYKSKFAQDVYQR